MSFISKLQEGVYEVTGRVYANWTPQDPVDLGDIGRISGSRFLKDTTLKAKGCQVQPSLDRQVGSLEYKKGVTINAKTSAKSGADGASVVPSIDISMKFGSEGSFVYHLTNLTYERFGDRSSVLEWLGVHILSGSFKWLDDYVLIDEVRMADQGSVIVSDSSNAEVNFSCDVDADDQGFLSKVGAEAGASIQSAQVMRFMGLEKPKLFYHPIELIFDSGDGPGPLTAALKAVKQFFEGEAATPEKVKMLDYSKTDNGPKARFLIAGNGKVEISTAAIDIEDFVSRESQEEEELPEIDAEIVKIEKQAYGT